MILHDTAQVDIESNKRFAHKCVFSHPADRNWNEKRSLRKTLFTSSCTRAQEWLLSFSQHSVIRLPKDKWCQNFDFSSTYLRRATLNCGLFYNVWELCFHWWMVTSFHASFVVLMRSGNWIFNVFSCVVCNCSSYTTM